MGYLERTFAISIGYLEQILATSRVVTNQIDSKLATVENGLLVLSKVAMGVMMVAIVATTTGRYLFNSPIPGVVTLVTEYLMPAVVFFSVAYVERVGGNVAVEVFEDRLSVDFGLVKRGITLVLLIPLLSVIVYLSAEVAIENFVDGSKIIGSLPLPTFITWVILTAGLFLLTVRLVVDSILEGAIFK